MKIIFNIFYKASVFVLLCSMLSSLSLAEGQWRLDWSDEFDSEGHPSEENWTSLEGYLGFNKELQRYTSDLKNASVKDGVLRIEVHSDPVFPSEFKRIEAEIQSHGGDTTELKNEEITSARLVTYGKRAFSNARVEVRARFSAGRGSWPAIWLLGDESKRKWPNCGEIDIMEHVGHSPNIIHSSVHSKHSNFREGNHSSEKTKVASVEDFHVYGVEWSEDTIDFSLDGLVYHTLEKGDREEDDWPFTKEDEFHLILNIAVGGGWAGKKGLDKAALPFFMEVDYVRVFERID